MMKYLSIAIVVSIFAVFFTSSTLQAALYTSVEKHMAAPVHYVADRGNKKKLSAEERKARAKRTSGKPRKEISPEEKEKRKKARQAKRAKNGNGGNKTVKLSAEERKKKNKENFKNRLDHSTPQEKAAICKRRQDRCNKAKENNAKSRPACEIVQELCP